MAGRPVLDSDVLIDYIRGKGPGAGLIDVLGPTLSYFVTAISAFELAMGRSYARDPDPVHDLLSAPCLPLTVGAGLRGGAAMQALRARNQALDFRDAMQAGICLEAGLPLVTRNLAHFERVDGLIAVHPEHWPPDRAA